MKRKFLILRGFTLVTNILEKCRKIISKRLDVFITNHLLFEILILGYNGFFEKWKMVRKSRNIDCCAIKPKVGTLL